MENNLQKPSTLEIIPLEQKAKRSNDFTQDERTSLHLVKDQSQQVPFTATNIQQTLENEQKQQVNEEQDQQIQSQQLPKQVSPVTSQQHRRIFKIIVIGDSNVGKTCLTFRFCGGKFLQRSEATIGVDFREKTIQIDDESIKLQIWDTG